MALGFLSLEGCDRPSQCSRRGELEQRLEPGQSWLTGSLNAPKLLLVISVAKRPKQNWSIGFNLLQLLIDLKLLGHCDRTNDGQLLRWLWCFGRLYFPVWLRKNKRYTLDSRVVTARFPFPASYADHSELKKSRSSSKRPGPWRISICRFPRTPQHK